MFVGVPISIARQDSHFCAPRLHEYILHSEPVATDGILVMRIRLEVRGIYGHPQLERCSLLLRIVEPGSTLAIYEQYAVVKGIDTAVPPFTLDPHFGQAQNV